MLKQLIKKYLGREEIGLDEGIAFLRTNGVDLNSLELPRLGGADLHYAWFEGLSAKPTRRGDETIIKIKGKYITQARTGYREGGDNTDFSAIWLPAEPCKFNINLETKLSGTS